MRTGPVAPIMTDQNRAGRSRAAQRQYLRGVDQKMGAADMMSLCVPNKGLEEGEGADLEDCTYGLN